MASSFKMVKRRQNRWKKFIKIGFRAISTVIVPSLQEMVTATRLQYDRGPKGQVL